MKLDQVLSASGFLLPGFAIVQEHAGCEEELKGVGDNLGGGIGSISGGDIVKGVSDLAKEAFDRLIGIVDGLEVNVIILEVGCGDASVFGIYMIKDVASGYI